MLFMFLAALMVGEGRADESGCRWEALDAGASPFFRSLPVLPGGLSAQRLRPGNGAVQLPARGDGTALRRLRAGRLRIPALRR